MQKRFFLFFLFANIFLLNLINVDAEEETCPNYWSEGLCRTKSILVSSYPQFETDCELSGAAKQEYYANQGIYVARDYYVAQCYKNLFLIIANQTRNSTLCQDIQLGQEFSQSCFTMMAQIQNDPTLCDQLPDYVQGSASCLIELAIAQNNPALCEKVCCDDKEFCYYHLALTVSNPLYCDLIPSLNVKFECLQKFGSPITPSVLAFLRVSLAFSFFLAAIFLLILKKWKVDGHFIKSARIGILLAIGVTIACIVSLVTGLESLALFNAFSGISLLLNLIPLLLAGQIFDSGNLLDSYAILFGLIFDALIYGTLLLWASKKSKGIKILTFSLVISFLLINILLTFSVAQ